MNKIWILLMAAVLSFNAQAADEKAKKPKGKSVYAKMVASLKLTAEQKPKFQALQKELRRSRFRSNLSVTRVRRL